MFVRRAELGTAERRSGPFSGRREEHRDGKFERRLRPIQNARPMDKSPRRVLVSSDSGYDFLVGDHWFGPTSPSFVDPVHQKLINTIQIHSLSERPEDRGGFSVPFFTFNGPYFVPYPNKDNKGVPLLLRLRDLTSEGIVGQFTLFDYVASDVSADRVFGYSPKSDRVTQYSVDVITGKFRPVMQSWVTHIFEPEPTRSGYWKSTWEAGHGSDAWIHDEIRLDPKR